MVYDPHRLVSGSQAGYYVGVNLTFECSSGYHLVGPHYITCLSNGNWSNMEPQCVEGGE